MTRGKGTFVPFTLYSEVVGEFASLEPGVNGATRYYDHSGREYTEEQFDSILPSFYTRQLIMDGRLPDSILGRAVTKEMLENEDFIFISHPASLNAHVTPLYFLFESMSKRVNLEMPDEVFRFTDNGIEFVKMDKNLIDRQKSLLFQKVFEEKGVAFPIKLIAGNPTTQKPYDNGYLLLDASNRLYHFKQTVGRPFLRLIPLPGGVVPEALFVTEYTSRRHLAFMTDEEGQFYEIRMPGYKIMKTGLSGVQIKEEKVTIFGNAFYYTVGQNQKDGVRYTALDAETLDIVKTLHFETREAKSFFDYIVPFKLSFSASADAFFLPRITRFSFIGTMVWLVFFAGWLVFKRHNNPRRSRPGLRSERISL